MQTQTRETIKDLVHKNIGILQIMRIHKVSLIEIKEALNEKQKLTSNKNARDKTQIQTRSKGKISTSGSRNRRPRVSDKSPNKKVK